MERRQWQRIGDKDMLGFGIGFAIFLGLVLLSEPGFVLLLDHANLLFHEAGHPLVGLFSQRLEPYGGTLGQLMFPCVLMVEFWRRGQALPFAAAVIWFFQNWLNIARYLADARALELPLVGGGDHDWNTILSRWGLLEFDTTLAAFIQFNAWLGIAAAVLWALGRWWGNRRRVPRALPSDAPTLAAAPRND